MKKTIYFLLLFLLAYCSNAQVAATDSKGEIKQVQPRVMVIPRVNEGQDIRNILDQNEPLRVAVTKMKEWFDTREFRTIDFVAQLKAALANKVFTSENQTDMKTMILQMADPDIYVELDVTQVSCSGASIARINMNAYYTATGLSIGSNVAQSPCNNAELGRLIQKALDDNADKFLNTMATNFKDLAENGVPIYMEFGFTQNSSYTMSSEIAAKEGAELSDIIEEWIENAAYKNQYNPPVKSDKRLMVSDVRIPLRDSRNNKNYTPNKFALEIQNYLKSLGIANKKDNKTGGIFITIQ